MVSVNRDDWMRRLKKLRGWGRSSAAGEPNDLDTRLETELDGTPYDMKFVFDEVGYNFLTTEACAAFGVEQVKKLEGFAEARQRNFDDYHSFFSEYDEYFVPPKQRDDVETCWLAFALTIRDDAPFEREDIVRHLEANRIQTRPLWSGNLLKHPGFKNIDARLPFDEYPNADTIMRNSLVFGMHQSLTDEDREYVKDTFAEFLEKQ
jgi:CDP-6-deoxy-D-xylo-4-hexulose-3-dehydrase